MKIFFILLCAFGTLVAETVSLQDYSALVGSVNPERKNIKTLNNCGSTYCYFTELTEAFLRKCEEGASKLKVLEIGCAFGVKSSQIVQTGVTLFANDLDARHLEKMKEAFATCEQKNTCFLKTHYIHGNILDASAFEQNQFDAILCESVLHFLTPLEIPQALTTCASLLKEGGELFITVASPYLQHVFPVYEANKQKGELWPGFIADPEILHPAEARLHKPYLFFDKETLQRELELAGFEIVHLKYIEKPHLEHDMALDGREGLIAIARKSSIPTKVDS